MSKGLRCFTAGCLYYAVVALVAVWPAPSHAQTTSPEDEYKKLIRVDQEIHPLGENPFGESVSLYDGSFSFQVTDVTVPGNGPLIRIGRTFKADGDTALRQGNAAFGDWDIDLPKLTTIASDADTIISGPVQKGWLVDSVARTDRCTHFGAPPALRHGSPGSEDIPPEKWWNEDYQLKIPGDENRTVLTRAPESPVAPTMAGYTFVANTKDDWAVGCLASTANGEPGEAFIAVGPDGTKYWLNYLVYRAARPFVVLRKMGYMLATRVEDRFGNWVTYTYTAGKLTSVDASDGRHVVLDYIADGTQIWHVIVTGAGVSRTWTYGYDTTSTGYTLTAVTLPDGSMWTYQFANLGYQVKSFTPNGHCLDPNAPDTSVLVPGSATAPSGLSAAFEAHLTRHGRSGVTEMCDIPGGGNATIAAYELTPRYYNNLALTKKTFSGAGIDSQIWTYMYPVATASWKSQCAAGTCDYTSRTEVADPSSNVTRYTFSNRFDVTEGQLLRTDYFNGPSTGAVVRSEANSYALPTDGTWPWPVRFGYSLVSNLNTEKVVQLAPLKQRVITQDGDAYTWQAVNFDARARPYYTKRFSSAAGQLPVQEQTTYLDDTAKWVIGLPTQFQNLTTGQVVSQTDYDAGSRRPSARRKFGLTVMSYGFNAQGLLATFTDGNQHTTTLSNYKRGIPQSIAYPDGTSQTLAVDDLGQITAMTDQAGRTSTYSYDSIGRVQKINYPAGDTVSWAPIMFSYSNVAASERGIGPNHWRRITSQGNKATATYFDALMRPVLSSTYRASDSGLADTNRTRFDWKGNVVFEGWPVNGIVDAGAVTLGLTTSYDTLSRPTQTTQPSELGTLTTTTSYLSGAKKQVVDAKGAATVTSYQVFDSPSYNSAVLVQAPEGVVQTIARTVLGDPISITQGGAGSTITKTMTYDVYNRLCRTTEPETGSSVVSYDAASNVLWTSNGQGITGAGCGQEQVADAAKITRSYDTLNRVTNVAYPAGTPSAAYSYTPTGKVNTATFGGVLWTYDYNKLDLLAAQTLSIDGYTWPIGYGYDANGALAAMTYPNSKAVALAPDALGRPTTAGAYATGATYHPDGELEHFTFANGADYTVTKNSRTLLDAFVVSRAGVVNVGESFSYDANANIVQINDLASGSTRTRTLAYDFLNRLTTASAVNLWGTETYTYDTLNNIRSMVADGQTKTFNYDASNRLASLSIGATTSGSYQYDARGNVISRNGTALTFDQADHLAQVSGIGSFLYDADGRRVKKTPASGSPTYYAYSQSGQLIWQYEPATTSGTDFIYLGKKLVASASDLWVPPPITPSVLNVGLPANPAYITTAWSASTAATSYQLQQMFNSGAWAGVYTGAGTSFTVQSPVDGVYYYRVAACNAGGCSSWTNSTAVGVDHMPSAPAVLNVALAGDLSGILTAWSPSAKATSYTLEQSFNGGGWAALYTGSATTFTVASPPDGTYNFRVKACNGTVCSGATASTAVGVYHPIAAIGAISVPATSNGPISIGWSTAGYATSYALEQNWGGGWAEIYRGGANAYSYAATVTGGYSYRARGCNAGGCGGYSPVGSSTITIPPSGNVAIATPGTNHNGSYSISWGGIAGAATYHLVEQVNGGGWAEIKNDAAMSWGTSGRGNATYGYMVQGCNAGGCAPWSGVATVVVTLIPNPPGNFGVTDTVLNSKNETRVATWNASTGATSYQLKDFNTGQVVYNSTGLSFTVERGVPGNLPLHSYQLAACNSIGCSVWKNPDYSN